MPPLSAIIESYLIASSEGLSSVQILALLESYTHQLAETNPDEWKVLSKISAATIDQAIADLNTYYTTTKRSFHIEDTAFGWKMYTNAEFAPYLEHLYPAPKAARLSQPALETLAMIAYRQPITKASIEAVRGVSSDGMIHKLMDAELVKIAGRADLPGRPLLYETTSFFFEHFGVKSIEDLPNSSELRNMAWPTANTDEETDSQMTLGEFHQRTLEESDAVPPAE